jgi:drug/metabolite transporter (DMT)-like permease
MAKLLILLLVGLTFESIGIVFLKKGLTQIGEVKSVTPGEILRVLKAGVTNRTLLLGVFFEAIFFGILLLLLSKSDVTFLWPLTALTFVFSTLAAILYLKEQVDATRWIGIALIMAGAGLVSWSEKQKEKAAPPAVEQPGAPKG